MQPLPLRGPVAAEVGFRGAAIGPPPPVKRAIYPVGAEVAARRYDFHVQRILLAAGNLAQVGRLAGADERFQARVFAGTEYLDLEVPAAGGAECIVRRPAGGADAGVRRQDREPVPGVHGVPYPEAAMIHEPEPAPAELAGLRRPAGPGRRPAFEPMRLALGAASRFLQESAGHMQGCFHDKVTVPVVQAAEIHKLRVAQQPGGLVIEGIVAFVQLADSQGNRQASALRAEALAGWSWSQSGIRIG
jgi:hypothetical protein